MEGLYKRNKECDRDIEERFGKPLWGEARITKPDEEGNRVLFTPMPTPGLWRVDLVKKEDLNG